MKITNNHGISLPLAVWLLYDQYDYIDLPNYISATTLLRSTKQIILSKRVEASDMEMDISEKIAASFGTAVHDSIEKAWAQRAGFLMQKLGYPKDLCERIVVNPKEGELQENSIPIYFEKRGVKEINGWNVGGKFDTVMDGRLFDYKTTSTYTYTAGNKDEDYQLQGSIYRWLNPELITDDFIYINFVFTDWQKYMVREGTNYPKLKLLEHPVPLLSLEKTEEFIIHKTNEISRLKDKPESELPPCTDKELWRSEAQYKYYSDPTKTDGKSSKNFDTLSEANAHCAEKGKGIVKTVPGEVKACLYCAAFQVCQQRKLYFAEP